MNRFEKFDDEIKKEVPVDESLLQKKKKRTRLIKRGMLFFLKLFLYHFATMIFYGVAFSSMVAQGIRDQGGVSGTILLLFSIATILLFAVFIAFDLAHDGEEKRSFKDLARRTKYTFGMGARLTLNEAVLYSVIYFVFQLPFCLFYQAFGFDHFLTTGFEKYYVMDLGLMELTGNGYLGALLDTLLLFLCIVAVRCFIYRGWDKDKIEK